MGGIGQNKVNTFENDMASAEKSIREFKGSEEEYLNMWIKAFTTIAKINNTKRIE